MVAASGTSPRECCNTRPVPIYRLHDTTGEDLGLLEHPAPNLEPGHVVVVADGREALVTARVEAEPGWGQLVALLEVAVSPDRTVRDGVRAHSQFGSQTD